MPKYKLSCEKCGSSDAVTDYGSHSHCYSCGNHINYNKKNNNELSEFAAFPVKEATDTFSVFKTTPASIDLDKVVALTDRGLSKQTANFYNVWVTDKGEQVYPYFSRDGKSLVANKFRTAGQKGFLVQGDISKTGLFGQQLFPAGHSKQITITEGELDALSVYQMTGSKYPCVSVRNAATARKDVADNYEYLDSFETIVICFDKDQEHKRPDGTTYFPGQEAAEKVAAMFKPGKVRLLTLKDAKDANDYLKNGWVEKFQKEWWAAPQWVPHGLKLAKDLWEEVRELSEQESVEYPWTGLNELLYGMRLSEVILIKADTGVGKTSVVKELESHILKNSNHKIGLLHLEESNKDTLLGLMSISANKPLHLPDVRRQVEDEELRKYFDDAVNSDRVVVWDHFGSSTVENVLGTIRHMNALGCKFIILDHLSIVVSDQNGDERKQLDEISTKLKQICMELNCCVICVIHINRQGQVRGSAGPEQIANAVINLDRDKLNEDEEIRNTTKVSVEKNRFCGKTGPACYLRYDSETGRLVEMPRESFNSYEGVPQSKETDW